MRWLCLFFLLAGCSGYRFSQQENPLAQYGIQSLSIPMFYNYSNLAELSTDFTRETYRLLMSYSGLKVTSGYNKNADAVLIGIIKSPERLSETITPKSPRVAQSKAPEAVGANRQDFSVPGASDIHLSLHVIVIKRPSEEELALLKSGIGDQIKGNSRVIFNEVIPIRASYTREILDGTGVQVNSTQNAGAQRRVLKNLAETAAISVRDLIFYAF
jgi:hypothetical protein